jgi:hypothetical protein
MREHELEDDEADRNRQKRLQHLEGEVDAVLQVVQHANPKME